MFWRGAAGDEETRIAMKMRRARFFAKFTLSRQSEILRYAQDDSERLRMTAGKRFSAACKAPPFQFRGEKSGLAIRLSSRAAMNWKPAFARELGGPTSGTIGGIPLPALPIVR
jgi:hypothetical protein